MLQFFQTGSGDVPGTQDDAQAVRSSYLMILAVWVLTLWTAVNICEQDWVQSLVKGAASPGDHQEVHWYPLEEPHTLIHKNAKNTQYSSFVNNLIGISTRVGGTSMWTR